MACKQERIVCFVCVSYFRISHYYRRVNVCSEVFRGKKSDSAFCFFSDSY